MKKSSASDLYDALEDFCLSQSFRTVPVLQQFRKETATGFVNVILSAPAPYPVLAELHLGVRIDLVETLVYQFTNGSISYSEHSTTLITTSGKITGNPYQRFSIPNEVALPRAVQQMQHFLEEQGFPFLERYSSIKTLDELYNEHPTRKSSYLPHFFHRCLRGITLAKMAQRPRWSDLVISYRSALIAQGTPPLLIDQYDRLTDYLRTFSVN